MILPTLNGESVAPTGQPAPKTEERKVNGFPTCVQGWRGGGGAAVCKGCWVLSPPNATFLLLSD